MASRILQSPHPKASPMGTLVLVAAIVVVLVAGWAFAFGGQSRQDQGVQAIREAVERAANECVAVEGGYAPSLDYLEVHYGLRVNRVNYVVQYEAFADNVPPTIVVRVR